MEYWIPSLLNLSGLSSGESGGSPCLAVAELLSDPCKVCICRVTLTAKHLMPESLRRGLDLQTVATKELKKDVMGTLQAPAVSV